ncbi:(d)CMP kinase [Brevibacterium sp. GP-SGM9]|uniref:(d)CMP kinase n=1 Tax=unclassified Brevibacterium TaxID=2614124 RepID=UPI001E390759|nr:MULTISPECIES: (d)CMP kinase [unclassified Brevibacterium]MCD1285220.1 cytidylate kinase [Brevibacterium sp. CCUG 69071]MDK8435157.1 (d)CMP kinase [Brevibacterium sp. H-BE7]
MSVVAIDGPSGVGKSSTAKEVARRLRYQYLDTGAMYRAMAWLCLNRGVTDPVDVLEQVRGVDLEISTDPDEFFVSVDGIDVSEEIREAEVSENVQTVSAVVDAREELIDMQRQYIAAAGDGIVVEGRDITTVVAPDAQVRILMTARDEVRVARRAKELHGNADAEAIAATQSQVTGRDAKDSATTSFLEAADGVYTLDTSDIDFDQVVETVLQLVKDSQ